MENAYYYSNVRRDIASVLPAAFGSVLEVGCASGATLKWLREDYGAGRTVGLELNAELADDLSRNVDVGLIGPAEEPGPAEAHGPYDLVLLLDVLEHLSDPWSVLRAYVALLAPGGHVVLSIPNIAHASVIAGLMRQRFRYARDGILDRTHLRFFTYESMVQLIEGAGLRIEAVTRLLSPDRPAARWMSRLSGGGVDGYLALQYVIRAAPAAEASNEPIVWTRQWRAD